MAVDAAPHVAPRATTSVAPPGAGPSPNVGPPPFVIGPNVSLTGILQVDGEVWLESRVAVDIRCRMLVVAPHASIDGVIVADHVVIYGTVQGEVYCNRVAVKDNSRVEAELYYRSIELEPGGLFEGRTRRHEDPIALSPDFD